MVISIETETKHKIMYYMYTIEISINCLSISV